jgi:hypothetical protein
VDDPILVLETRESVLEILRISGPSAEAIGTEISEDPRIWMAIEPSISNLIDL